VSGILNALETIFHYVRFEVLTIGKVPIMFWVVTPCGLIYTSVQEKHAVPIFRTEVRIVVSG
jgi:hypothetical protein